MEGPAPLKGLECTEGEALEVIPALVSGIVVLMTALLKSVDCGRLEIPRRLMPCCKLEVQEIR
jgi:hypothetical protein